MKAPHGYLKEHLNPLDVSARPSQVNVASASASQVVVATGEGHLLYFEIELQALKEVATIKLENEISCLDMTPLGVPAFRALLPLIRRNELLSFVIHRRFCFPRPAWYRR